MKFLLTWSRIPALAFMESSHDELLHELLALLNEQLPIEYCIICIEKHNLNGEDDDGVHFHAAVKLKERIRKSIRSLEFYGRIPNVKYLPNKKDWLQGKKYCKKDGEYIEYGVDETKNKLKFKEKVDAIKVNSLSNFIKDVAECKSDIQLFNMINTVVKKPYSGIRKLYWFYGETGTGKTRKAWNIMKEECEHSGFAHASISFSAKQFVNGYAGQEIVLIDDLRKSDIDLNILLKMLDRYEYIVNVKGGFMNWDAQIIIITSHFSPQDCYSYESDGEVKLYDNVNQLLRRLKEFGEVIEFYKENEEFKEKKIELTLN